MKVRYAALGLALALAGCAAPYQSPAPGSKDVARVRVAQARQGTLLLAMELPGACLPNLKWGTGYRRIAVLDGKGMHIGPTTRTVLGMPDARQQEGDFTEFLVSADRPFHLGTSFEKQTGGMISSCLIGLTFLPQAGADYEALVTPDDNGCRLALTRLEQQGATIVRDPVPFSRIRSKCE